MKKKWLLLCLSAFAMLVFACVRDETEAPSAPLPDGILSIKSFFDSEIGSVALPDRARLAGAAGGAAVTRGADGVALLTATSTPDWSGATTYRDGEMEMVQVPLTQSSLVTALVRMTDSLGNVVHTKKRVVTWLLVGTSPDGTKGAMTATVIPGKHYLASQDNDPQSATMYTTHDLRGTNFTGTVLYATTEGRLIQGRNYDNGQVVGTLWLRGDYQLLAARAEEEKIAENEDYPGLVHARGHANGNHGNAYGHDKENNGRGHAYGRQRQIGTAAIELIDERAATPGYVLSFEGGWGPNTGDDGWGNLDPIVVTPGDGGDDLPPWVCPVCHDPACDGDCWVDEPDPEDDPYDPIDDDPGSGGGGSSGPPVGTPIMARPDLPTTMRQQRANRCVSSSMSYVSRVFGGNSSDGDFARAYKDIFNQRIDKNGVSVGQMPRYINDHFTTVPFTDYRSAIDQGHVVMVAVQEPSDPIFNVFFYQKYGTPYVPGAHSVVVIGYGSGTDQLTVMDPLTGRQDTITQSEVKDYYHFVITGNK